LILDEFSKEENNLENGEKIFYLYTCGRDGTFKKFTVKNNYNNSYLNNTSNLKGKDFSLSLKESKNFYSLNSIEDFFIIKNDNYKENEIEDKVIENIYFVGHYGRYLCLYDLNNNLNFYSNEIKGVHRPFDIIMKNEESKILIFKILLN